jgi:photosystem II stability/assembly factor-like uncharacterized protein
MKRTISLLIFIIVITIVAPAYLISKWVKVDNLPPIYAHGYYLEINFLKSNPKLGWICGYDGAVLRTTDSGTTWKGTTIKNAYHLESISFVDSLHGYTSGEGQLYKSVDGGVTWQDITTDELYFGQIWGNCFTSKDSGIVVGGGCNINQSFFRTTNAGKSWTVYNDSVKGAGLTDVILYDSKGLGYASGSGKIFRTLDGGIKWNVFSTTGKSAFQEDLSVYNSTFLVPYNGGCSGGNADGGVRMSTDNGLSWNSKAYDSIPFFGSFLLDSLRGWACGWNKHIIFTSDGGINWSIDNEGIPEDTKLDDLYFFNDSTGFVVGKGVYKYGNPTVSIESSANLTNIVKIYPNPVNDLINIDFAKKTVYKTSVMIYSANGTLVFESSYSSNSSSIKINTTNFPIGYYSLILNCGTYFEHKKLVIIR